MTKPWFRLRSVAEEFEARLTATALGATGEGKAERKRYTNGEERLKVRARNLAVPDGSMLTIRIAGHRVADVTVHRGRITLNIEGSSATVPQVQTGQVMELMVENVVLLAGSFLPD